MSKNVPLVVLLVALLSLTACSSPERSPSPPTASARSGASTPSPPADASPGAVVPGEGDLARGPVTHTLTSPGLKVTVSYSPAPEVGLWTPDGTKALQITVSVVNRGKPARKVYLSRATLGFTLDDGSSQIPGPEPLTDTSNIVPGYLATVPYTYVQSFSLPALDRTCRTLVIDTKLELVSLVDAKVRDYTKVSVTDSLRATLSF